MRLFLTGLYFLLLAGKGYAQQPVAVLKFISTDVRIVKSKTAWPATASVIWNGTGWEGEVIAAQLLLQTRQPFTSLSLRATELSDSRGHVIPTKAIQASFIHFVWANGLNADGGGCGIPVPGDSSLVADRIGNNRLTQTDSGTLQPLWLRITIPCNIQAGQFSGKLLVWSSSHCIAEIGYKVNVQPRKLPVPGAWHTDLDLWQNPYSIARWYHVRPWSAAHFRLMKPYMQQLGQAGQKTITATLIDDPWNGQTFDIYHSMIGWIQHTNHSWSFNYHIFDRWVAFMVRCGIRSQINCYGMLPWNNRFTYYNESRHKDTVMIAAPSSAAYRRYWYRMLCDFARHLKKKGWQGKVYIAMDERPLPAMQAALAVIKKADPTFKVALAGVYHPELADLIQDYSLPSTDTIPAEQLTRRTAKGYHTTFYTCCTEGTPNTFTFSPTAESAWLPLYAHHKGFNGYLRWAYNCWNKKPVDDSRFGTWASGDAFLVYPDNNSSIRFERLKEGMQYAEKADILRSEFQRKKQTQQLRQLDAAFAPFELRNLKTIPADRMVEALESTIDLLSDESN